jgi:hypothetical protein
MVSERRGDDVDQCGGYCAGDPRVRARVSGVPAGAEVVGLSMRSVAYESLQRYLRAISTVG